MHLLEVIWPLALAEERAAALHREAAGHRLAIQAAGSRRPGRSDPAAEAWAGFRESLPLWLGIVPFGVAFALAAPAAGLSPVQAAAMSLLVYAGSAQVVATELLAQGAGGLAVVLAVLVVALRHLPLGASLAGRLGHLPWMTRAALAFQFTDPSYAISSQRLLAGRVGAAHLAGSGLSLYLAWQTGTLAGLWLGGTLPDPRLLGLELVFPLSFLALLVPTLRTRPTVLAALVGGGLALVGSLVLPAPWYLLLGILGGSLAGALAQEGPSPATTQASA